MRERKGEGESLSTKAKSQTSWKINFDDLFTIFIDGLHPKIDSICLRFMFKEFGTVMDSFIPFKMRKNSSCRFGFIRFKTMIEATRAIKALDGVLRFGNIISVSMSKYGRRSTMMNDKNSKSPIDYKKKSTNQSFADALKGRNPEVCEGHNRESKNRSIHVEGVEKEWLKRSIIGRLQNVAMCKTIGDIIRSEGVMSFDVKPLAGPFVLLICKDSEDMEALMENDASWLRNWFVEVEPWEPCFKCDFRFAWLSCIGIPLNAWDSDTFRKIGGVWGEFIELDNATRSEINLDRARVLISTNHVSLINESLDLIVDNHRVTIRVMEEFVTENVLMDNRRPLHEVEESSDDEESKYNENEQENKQGSKFHPERTFGKEEVTMNINVPCNYVDKSSSLPTDDHDTTKRNDEKNEVTQRGEVSILNIDNSKMDYKSDDECHDTTKCNGAEEQLRNDAFIILESEAKLNINPSDDMEINTNQKEDDFTTGNDKPQYWTQDEVSVVKESQDIDYSQLKNTELSHNFNGSGLSHNDSESLKESKDYSNIGKSKKGVFDDIEDEEGMGETLMSIASKLKKKVRKNKKSNVVMKKKKGSNNIKSFSDLRNEIILKEATNTLKLGKLCGLSIIGDEDEFLNKLIDMEIREIEKWGKSKRNSTPKFVYAGV